MQVSQIQVGKTLERVGQFIDAHADIANAVNRTVGRQQLNEAAAALRAALDEQNASSRDRRGESTNRVALESRLVKKYMTPMSKFARGQLKGRPNYAALTPAASKLHAEALIAAARGMVKAALPYIMEMEGKNFAPGFLNDLGALADAAEAARMTTAESRRRNRGATEAVADALKAGRAAIRTLDSIVSHLILGDGPREAEWRSAKRVAQSTGLREVKKDEPEGQTVPAGTTITSTAGKQAQEAPATQEVKAA